MEQIPEIFKKKKFISLDKFIKFALYDKNIGYYMKKNPFGKKGDFITAPIISNLFAEMITIWCVAFWEHLKKPKKIVICELGPGDGSLCEKILNTSKRFKEFYDCLEIKLVEKSKILKNIQRSKIINRKVKWLNKIENINSGPIIFLGNEFFDSLPIKQIYIKKNKFYEKFVCVDRKRKKIKFTAKKINLKLVKRIKKYRLSNYKNLIEYPIVTIEYLKKIIKKIKKYDGGILIIDYGYTKKNRKNTLQAIKNHSYSNILTNIGDTDISSYVDFNLFTDIFKRFNLTITNVVNQNKFLQKLGIIKRANIITSGMTFKQKVDLYYRLKKLLDYKEMGKNFKVLFAQKKGRKFSLGF